MSDQLQSLLQQTGAVTPAFPANSRYNKTPIANLTILKDTAKMNPMQAILRGLAEAR